MEIELRNAVYDILVNHAGANPGMRKLFIQSWPDCEVWNFSIPESGIANDPFRKSWQAYIRATGIPRTPAMVQCNVAEELTEERAELIIGVNNELISLFNPIEIEEVLGRRVPAVEVAQVINKARIGRVSTQQAVVDLIALGLLIDCRPE